MRNIRILYTLTFCFNLTFWSGIWLLYYQNFTNYSGIGLIETVAIATGFLTEIPSGALADLIGRKKTLILAFLIRSIGEMFMGFATLFLHLPLSVFLISSGYSFLSGSHEAIIYDSLKELGREVDYAKTLANIKSIELTARATASVIGGYLYSYAAGIPFIATAIASFFGFCIAWFLKEPVIDSQKFSFKKYLHQTQQGFHQIFAPKVRRITVSLFVLAAFYLVMYEVGGDALIVEFGFSEKQLGIYYALLFITSAAATQLTTLLHKIFSPKNLLIIITAIFSVILIVAPLLNPVIAAAILITSAWIHFIFDNSVSSIINHQIDSRDRATAISTFKMIQAAPYVLLAFFIGRIMDQLTAKGFSIVVGSLLVVALIPVSFIVQSLDKNLKLSGR